MTQSEIHKREIDKINNKNSEKRVEQTDTNAGGSVRTPLNGQWFQPTTPHAAEGGVNKPFSAYMGPPKEPSG